LKTTPRARSRHTPVNVIGHLSLVICDLRLTPLENFGIHRMRFLQFFTNDE
jgi:hypothetical protein